MPILVWYHIRFTSGVLMQHPTMILEKFHRGRNFQQTIHHNITSLSRAHKFLKFFIEAKIWEFAKIRLLTRLLSGWDSKFQKQIHLFILDLKHFSWVNIVREVQCLYFRRISSLPFPLTWRKLIFSQLLWVGQPKPGSKYEFEKKRSKGGNPLPQYQATPLPPVMNEWEIDAEAGL